MRQQKYILFIAICAAIVSAHAQDTIQKTIGDIYLSAPLSECAMLTPEQRFELIEYAKVGQHDTITNFLGGKSWMDSINTQLNYLKIHQTENTTLELLLKNNEMLVVKTYYSPLGSSNVAIYNTQWQKIREINIEMDDCENLIATFVTAKIDNETILLENETLKQIFDIEKTKYKDCPKTQIIPLPF